MRAIYDYFETNLRHVLATEIRHCNHNRIAVTPNRWIRHICDSRTNVVRLSHESLANVSRHSRDIRATFARHSHDVRPMKLRAFITIDRLTTISRTSCVCRATVARRSCDCRTTLLREMINQEKWIFKQTLKLQTRKVLRCCKELGGWKDCWKVTLVGVLDCWMVANIELEKSYSFILHSYDGPSSSLRKSVENAHALIAHTYAWWAQSNQNCNEFGWASSCENLFDTDMRTAKAHIRLHWCAFKSESKLSAAVIICL